MIIPTPANAWDDEGTVTVKTGLSDYACVGCTTDIPSNADHCPWCDMCTWCEEWGDVCECSHNTNTETEDDMAIVGLFDELS